MFTREEAIHVALPRVFFLPLKITNIGVHILSSSSFSLFTFSVFILHSSFSSHTFLNALHQIPSPLHTFPFDLPLSSPITYTNALCCLPLLLPCAFFLYPSLNLVLFLPPPLHPSVFHLPPHLPVLYYYYVHLNLLIIPSSL